MEALKTQSINNLYRDIILAPHKKKLHYHYLIIMCLGILFICLPVIPIPGFYPSRDAGVFLYIGDLIRAGGIPYRDEWDHKGPLIFWIYAIGLEISSGTLWGPWLLQTFSLLISIFLCCKLLIAKFSHAASIIACSMMILAIVPTGLEFDLTEGYALPFQFLAIIAFDKIIDKPASYLWAIVLGLSGASAFLLKPNMIGAWIGIVAYLIITTKFKKPINAVTISILSGAVLLFSVAIYLWANDALYHSYIALWKFNREYATIGIGQRLHTAWELMKASSKVGFSTFAAIGLIISLQNWKKQNNLVKVCCIIFPIEIGLASLSGRVYSHYYIPLLASGSVLLGNAIHQLKSNENRPALNITIDVILLVTLVIQIHLAQKIATKNFLRTNDIGRIEAKLWINKNIPPDEKLLILGAEAGTHFTTKHKSICRFVYQYPILQSWSKNKEFITEFERCYFSSKPDWVIDAMKTDAEANILFIKNANDDPKHPRALKSIWKDLENNYTLIESLPNSGWQIYRKIK